MGLAATTFEITSGPDAERRGPGRIETNTLAGGLRVGAIAGVRELWTETHGDPEVCVALLDGPVDLAHPCFAGAALTVAESIAPAIADRGPACRHGTHLASLIFGQPGSAVEGLAPACRGLVIPIFEADGEAKFRPCSQLDLARALTLALELGANVINISGGQFTPSGVAHPLLADVLAACARRNVLLVAATGNEGCECLHVPAADETVLAVGAMDAQGSPLDFSNWGSGYEQHGLLAPGQNLVGAAPGGGLAAGTGTSFATAAVSGVAALLLSLQKQTGQKLEARRIREILLATAMGCDVRPASDCRRLLAGRLNVSGSLHALKGGGSMTPDVTNRQGDEAVPSNAGIESSAVAMEPILRGQAAEERLVQPSECSCKGQGSGPGLTLVYALGQIGYDFVSEARVDSMAQKIAGAAGVAPLRSLAFDTGRVLEYLDGHAWDAPSLTWVLSLNDTPIYAVMPAGPFAGDAYQLLRQFLREHIEEQTERISVGGVLAGRTTLLTGQVVPILVPEIGTMYSWTTAALVEAVAGAAPPAEADLQTRSAQERKRTGVHDFLQRVYHGLRNLGLSAQDRAINFAATNAFQIERIIESVLKDPERMELDTINVVPSSICRPGSDCWEVELYFFYPERQVPSVRKVYRFTVDVSDVTPVTLGPTRSWFTR